MSPNSHILFLPLCKLTCIISKFLSWWIFCPAIPATSSIHSIRVFGQAEMNTFLLGAYRNLQHPVLCRLGRLVKKVQTSGKIKKNQFYFTLSLFHLLFLFCSPPNTAEFPVAYFKILFALDPAKCKISAPLSYSVASRQVQCISYTQNKKCSSVRHSYNSV